MENNEKETRKDSSYYTDIISALAERTIKRLWIALILLIVLLVATNAAWLVYESQFTDEVVTENYEATADNDGVAIANGSGEVNYGG